MQPGRSDGRGSPEGGESEPDPSPTSPSGRKGHNGSPYGKSPRRKPGGSPVSTDKILNI